MMLDEWSRRQWEKSDLYKKRFEPESSDVSFSAGKV